jgi:aerobic C4-dicarboxylate transport protein
VPVTAMVLILGIDRFMSECRALTNIVGNGVATIVVASWEKELDRGMLRAQLGMPQRVEGERSTLVGRWKQRKVGRSL